MTSLAAILRGAIAGDLPPADGLVEVVPPPAGARAAIVAFTGHHVVAADIDPDWVAEACPRWAFDRPFGPDFVAGLAARTRSRPGTLDAVLAAARIPDAPIEVQPGTPDDLRAVLADARNPRTDHRLWRTPDGSGTLLLGRGLEGRWEAAIDVRPAARGRGLGTALVHAARALIPDGDMVFAQIAPGNVASLRAALRAGFAPFSAEILFFDGPPRGDDVA